MPIYSYRCDHCGFQQDILRRMSDPLLVTCPSCGESTFRKQVTAAGFQLKGSGWYVTDFRNAASKEAPKGGSKDGDAAAPASGGDGAAKTAPAATDTVTPAKPATPAAGSSGDAGSTKKASPPPATGST